MLLVGIILGYFISFYVTQKAFIIVLDDRIKEYLRNRSDIMRSITTIDAQLRCPLDIEERERLERELAKNSMQKITLDTMIRETIILRDDIKSGKLNKKEEKVI